MWLGLERCLRPGDSLQVAVAVEALGRYKLRTALSVLGVVCGVAGVVAMTSVSQGARADALAQMSRLGLDNLIVRATAGSTGGASTRSRLSAADVDRLRALVPEAMAVTPVVERLVMVPHRDGPQALRLVGIRPEYLDFVHVPLERGRRLSPLDDAEGRRVCVIGGTLAGRMFGLGDPVGRMLAMGADTCRVVGVLVTAARRVDASTLTWRDLDDVALMPIEAVVGHRLAIVPETAVDEIWIRVRDGRGVERASGVVGRALERIHGGPRDFEVVVPRQLLAQHSRTRRTFTIVVGSVAALALVVGGIGIMNVMLTSVIERTREIGLRRTVGATERDIRRQFLTESLLMTLGGGAIGVVAGVAASWAISTFAGWHTYVSPVAVIGAFATAASVGILFGLYPAIQAARLAPVEAVRYE